MVYKRRILSIDGGGIRGIIPALILAQIEQKTGKQIHELFDLIAGTSTGGILALGLTKPSATNPTQAAYSAQDLADLYKNRGAEIFHESRLEKLTPIDDILRPKYSSKGREQVLADQFGDTPITAALTEVFLASYEIEYRSPVFFTNRLEKEKTEGRSFRRLCQGISMHQATMATSAAPTYFQPYVIPTHHTFADNPMPALAGKKNYTLIDGGVFANNPTTLALIEARASYQQETGESLSLNDILVVSLGTGALTRVYTYEKAQHWGLVGWLQPLINIVLDGTSEVITAQLDQLLEPSHYYRFQGYLDLNKGNDEIDKVNPENIAELESLVQDILAQEADRLTDLCQTLLAM